jgi:hypothetical protein
VERVGVLIRAIRRLDAASAELEPVAVAERGLAALTRVRLAGLTSPGRGDEALAAVLARGAPAGGGEADAEGRAARRLAAPPAVAAPGHALSAATTLQRGGTVAAPAAGAADGSRAWPAPNPSGSARRRAVVAAGETRRRTTAAADAGAPTPPRGFDAAAGVAGLEWVAPRVPGGTEPAETRVVDGAPDAASPSRWTVGRDQTPRPRTLPAPAEPVPTIPAVELERAPEPGETRTWPAQTTPEPRALPRTAGRGLEALVRAWQDTGGAQPERLERATNVIPLETGDTATSTSTATPRTRTRDRSSEREDETLALGDALGRVLVAELRRYGVEVDAG